MLGWMKHKLEWRLPGEIQITSLCTWHHPYSRKQRRTKELLGESERGEWKNWLKTQHSENKGLSSQIYGFPSSHVWMSAAAAAAKSLQSCPTLCYFIDGSPPSSPIPRILQARILEWVAISFSNAWKRKVKVKSLSRVQLLVTPWTAAYQAPLSMGFSRQEYWSGLPLPSPLSSSESWRVLSSCVIGHKMFSFCSFSRYWAQTLYWVSVWTDS